MSDAVRAINHITLRDSREFWTEEPYPVGKQLARGAERLAGTEALDIEWTGPMRMEDYNALTSRGTTVDLETEQEIREARSVTRG